MQLSLADQHRQGDSPVHQLDPRVKVLLTLAFMLTASLMRFGAFTAYLALWCVVLGVVLVAKIGVGYVLRRSVVALPFAIAAITLPFTVPGAPLAVLPIFGGLTISDAGTIRFVSILIKSWLSLQMAIVLVSVTSFPDLLWSLRALRVPAPLIAIVSFMYRYLFVLAEEVARMLRARAARSAASSDQRSGGTLWWRGKVAGQMAGSLMIRSFERSERIYSAMLARGYQGQMRMLSQPHWHGRDRLVLIIGLSLLLLLFAGVYR